jgi:hypothetical protein
MLSDGSAGVRFVGIVSIVHLSRGEHSQGGANLGPLVLVKKSHHRYCSS